MLITVPIISRIDIDVHKLIEHCDETQLNELILLADKKLGIMHQTENTNPITQQPKELTT